MTTELPPLWQHQRQAIIEAELYYALFFDPGCGKTRTALELFKKHTAATNCNKTLIFCPLNVCRNWEREIKFYLSDLPTEIMIAAGDTRPKKIKVIEKFSDITAIRTNNFLICNIELLRGEDYVTWLYLSKASFIIVDESHNFKSHKSKQTKGLFTLLNRLKPKNLYLLTGTPAPQGELDLWTTLSMMKKTNDTFFIYQNRYFKDVNERRKGFPNYWPEYKLRAEKKQQLYDLIKSCSITARKDEVLDLPELLRVNLYTELSKEQVVAYNSMKEYLFAIDDNGEELNASNLLSRTLRLQQIIAGFIGDVPVTNNARIGALKEAIELTAGAQFLVWTIFRGTYGQISDVLNEAGISFGSLTGEQSAQERHEAMEAFQGGDIRALIAHPKAGGVGVNLTAASYSIHYTRSFSLVDDLQAEARNYRGGSEIHKRITRIDIVAADTIDEEISEALKQKKTVQEFILGLKKSRTVEYVRA